MALNAAWDQARERFRELERYAPIRPVAVAMGCLVVVLRDDPRLGAVEPSVSLGSLRLRPIDGERSVLVEWNEDAPRGFKVSYLDPPLELSEPMIVSEANVVAAIVVYLDGLIRT